MHHALEQSGEDLLIYGYPFPSENGYLSRRQMTYYRELFDSAEKAVASNRRHLKRVQTARLPLMYAELEQAKIFGTDPGGFYMQRGDSTWHVEKFMKDLLHRFVRRCKRAGITLLHEHGNSPDEYLASMNRFFGVSMETHKALFKPVMLSIPASQKYPAGGAAALTNGMKGLNDYHMNWLGFEGSDMEAVIDLGRVDEVREIHTDFLQAVISWVFLPVRVEYCLSEDGEIWITAAELKNSVDERTDGMFIHPFHAKFKPVRARFIKVIAENMKVCPDWHKGAGGPSWIFADEIIVR
jgi:hypothetical protein